MLFYGHSSHVNFSTQLEAVTACLALHSITIHLIRVITLIWLRCCSSAYCVTFIHCKKKVKSYFKENGCWHITAHPIVSTLLCIKTAQGLFFFFQWDGFWYNAEVREKGIVVFPETKPPSSCGYNVSVCLMGRNGESAQTGNDAAPLPTSSHVIVKFLSGSSMCGEIFISNHYLSLFCYWLVTVFFFLWELSKYLEMGTNICYKRDLNWTVSVEPCQQLYEAVLCSYRDLLIKQHKGVCWWQCPLWDNNTNQVQSKSSWTDKMSTKRAAHNSGL